MSSAKTKPTTDTAAITLIAAHLRTLNPGLRFNPEAAAVSVLAFAHRAGIASDQVVHFLYEFGDGVALWDARDTFGDDDSADKLRMDVYGVIP